MNPPYYMRVGDAFSQLINTAILGGDANESISGRASRIVRWDNPDHRVWNLAYRVINALFFLQENHCDEAYDNDVSRAARLLKQHSDRV